ncbi:hypothetical protein ACTXJG_11725 [Glutamicibacter arilaitensis]
MPSLLELGLLKKPQQRKVQPKKVPGWWASRKSRVAAGSVSAADGASFASAEDSLTEVAEAGTKVPANAREKTIPALIATLEKALCEVQCFFAPSSKDFLPVRPLFRRATLSPTGLPNTRIPQYLRTLGKLNLKNADWCVEFDARFPKTSA